MDFLDNNIDLHVQGMDYDDNFTTISDVWTLEEEEEIEVLDLTQDKVIDLTQDEIIDLTD